MATVVVDTNVVSYLHKDHETAKLYRPHVEGHLKVISFMTVAELYRWTIESNWGERKIAELETRLEDYFQFSGGRKWTRG